MEEKDDNSSFQSTGANVPCGRSASEVNKIVATFDELAALLLPEADTPISAESVGVAIKQLIVENCKLRDEAPYLLFKDSHRLEKNSQRSTDRSDPIFPTADGPGLSSSECSRKFYGRWREHWKVGARVELKKSNSTSDWLPGRITRAIDTPRDDPIDRYDVKLDNGDEVLEVNAADLRTLHEIATGAKKKDEKKEGEAFATIMMFLLCVFFVKRYILGI